MHLSLSEKKIVLKMYDTEHYIHTTILKCEKNMVKHTSKY